MNEPTHSQPASPQPNRPNQRPQRPQRSQQPLAAFLQHRTASRLRARRVRRLVRHIEPWSVLKMSLIFYFCLWVILLIAGVILWRFAVTAGTVENFENFIEELFALETFIFNPDQIFRVSALGGLVMVVAGSGFTVLMAVLFNLISDLVGGVRMTVVEEETARPRPKRTRPRTTSTAARPPRKPAQRKPAQRKLAEGVVKDGQAHPATQHRTPAQADDTPFWPDERRKKPKRGSLSKRPSDR